MPHRARSSGDSAVSSWPWNVIDPDRGGSRPMMLFNSVVLPTPFRPRRHTTWPGGTSRCTSHSTWLSPYDTLRLRIVSIDLMPSAQVDLDHTGVALHHVDGALTQNTSLVQYRDAMSRPAHKFHIV